MLEEKEESAELQSQGAFERRWKAETPKGRFRAPSSVPFEPPAVTLSTQTLA